MLLLFRNHPYHVHGNVPRDVELLEQDGPDPGLQDVLAILLEPDQLQSDVIQVHSVEYQVFLDVRSFSGDVFIATCYVCLCPLCTLYGCILYSDCGWEMWETHCFLRCLFLFKFYSSF